MKDDRIRYIMSVWSYVEDQEPNISTERLIETTKHVAKCSHDELMAALAAQSRKETRP